MYSSAKHNMTASSIIAGTEAAHGKLSLPEMSEEGRVNPDLLVGGSIGDTRFVKFQIHSPPSQREYGSTFQHLHSF